MQDVFVLPLSADDRNHGDIVDGPGRFVGHIAMDADEVAAAMHAVNCHDDLVAALEKAREYIFGDIGNGHPTLRMIDAALSKARGEA